MPETPARWRSSRSKMECICGQSLILYKMKSATTSAPGPSLLGTMILFFLRDLTKRFLGVDVAVRTDTMRSNESIKSAAPRLNDSQRLCQAPLAKIALGLVCLDYSAGVVQHADRCPVRAR